MNNNTHAINDNSHDSDSVMISETWQSNYDRIEPKLLSDNAIKLIGEDWMLVTAGSAESFNTMTASWGGVGFIWNKPSTFTFVRDTRYTYEFIQKEKNFTLSFFPEELKAALRICGVKSGRDTDKIAETGLTPIQTPSGSMSFSQARIIIECKKTFVQEIDTDNLIEPYKSDIIQNYYTKDTAKHQMLISQIINVWVKKEQD